MGRDDHLFRISLRADRDILSRGHRERPRDQSGDAGYQDVVTSRGRSGDANDQTRCRHDAVIGAEDGCAQPPDPGAAVLFAMSHAVPAFRGRAASELPAGRAPSPCAAGRRAREGDAPLVDFDDATRNREAQLGVGMSCGQQEPCR